MSSFVDVPYRHERDWGAVRDLLLHSQLTARTDCWPTIAELRIVCHPARTDWIKHVWLDATAHLRAFALLDHIYGSFWFWVHPLHAEHTVASHIIPWALQQRQGDVPAQRTIRCQVREDAVDTIALLDNYGFVQHDLCTLRMTRALDQPIPTPVLPNGFCIRPIAGEQEVAACVTLHTTAFGREIVTEEELAARRVFMRDSSYLADLDLVVVAPNGAFAAFCVGQVDQEGNAHRSRQEGWTDPIGTHPAFRRQGLARAVLLAGLQRLRAVKIDMAFLGTGSWNTATQRLCESVGFETIYKVMWYTKTAT